MFTSALKSFSSNITSNYAISSTPACFAGAWKVYDGKNKTTGKQVSVFVFERKSLEPPGGGLESRSSATSKRKLHDEVVERLKKEASSLARLRHPNVLELAEAVEDTRNGGLMFATEPITTTLAGLLQDQDDQDRSASDRSRSHRHWAEERDGRLKEVEIDELEIQKGLLQVAKGLEFLHESAGLVHGNLTPEAIYINQKSDWKISGLGFAGSSDTNTSAIAKSSPPIALSESLYHDPRLPRTVQMNLDFVSPDFVLDSNISSAADMFSLGLVVLALYNSPHESPLHTSGNISTYKKLFISSSTVPSTSNNFLCPKPLPKGLIEVLPRLITRRPAQRISASQFQQSGFFDNILVSTIRFLDSLPTKTPNEKSQFLRGLPRILEQFPKSVLDKKVLPALLEETKDRELLSLILQNVFKIIKTLPSSQRAFTDTILPRLREVFPAIGAKGNTSERDTAREAGLVVILDNIDLIAENCTGKVFKDDILPIIQLGLESPTHSLIDKSLGVLPTIISTLDFSTVKNDIFPIVAAVFSKTSSLGVKVRGLEAFVILCGGSPNDESAGRDGFNGAVRKLQSSRVGNSAILDKYTVQEKIVPLLKAIKTKEPAVIMAALAVYKQVGKVADSDFLAMDVLPTLWSFSLGPLLNLQQFSEYMDLIKILSAKIEQEQMKKLRDLSSNAANGFETTRSKDDLMDANGTTDTYGRSNIVEDDFERLVHGKTSRSNPHTQENSKLSYQTQTIQPTSPKYDWSNPAQTSSMSNVLRPQQASHSRAITPDQSLSSFMPLRPTQNNSSFGSSIPIGQGTMQPLQPMPRSTTTSNPWASPPQTNQPISNGWGSTAVVSNSGTSMAWSNPPAMGGQSINGMVNSGFTQSGTNLNTFSLPPPGGTARKGAEKKGLDAYESLI